MRITHEADYAVRIVYTLMQAEQPPVAASRLAEQSGVTLRFTLKILRKLAGSGIVCAQKGASGGYSLAMDPLDISLGLIIESIDGPFELNHCLNADFSHVKAALIDWIARRPEDGAYALDLLMIAKYLERIGDHATNVAEWVVFAVTGVHNGEEMT